METFLSRKINAKALCARYAKRYMSPDVRDLYVWEPNWFSKWQLKFSPKVDRKVIYARYADRLMLPDVNKKKWPLFFTKMGKTRQVSCTVLFFIDSFSR